MVFIRVRYPDGITRLVRPAILDHLIETKRIVAFRRSDGWVRIGIDPIRSRRRRAYFGPERRQMSTVAMQGI